MHHDLFLYCQGHLYLNFGSSRLFRFLRYSNSQEDAIRKRLANTKERTSKDSKPQEVAEGKSGGKSRVKSVGIPSNPKLIMKDKSLNYISEVDI
jgi:hypothetical protein